MPTDSIRAKRRRTNASWQCGAFLMARGLLLVLILLAMLVVPIYLKRGSDDKEKAAKAREEALINTPLPTAVPAAATTPTLPPSKRFGMTFGEVPSDGQRPEGVIHMSCRGQPVEFDAPKDAKHCNVYGGDTLCNRVLPILCIGPGDVPPPPGLVVTGARGWTGANLSASEPVMGGVIESAEDGSARCAKEFGSGWRMAEYDDGRTGQDLLGPKGTGFLRPSRVWVHRKGHGANCWNSGG